MKPTLIFDYDGTIHNTIVIYETAFRKCYEWLVSEGYAPSREIPAERIAGWLGMNSRDMWNSFLPELPERLKDEASRRVGSAMAEQIRAHQAVWYPGAAMALDQLRADGYTMVVVSNCKIVYHEANWKEFSMERWFAAFYDCESFGFSPKTEIIREVQKSFKAPYLFIGDRRGDLECALAWRSPFIGCRYGFGRDGELEGSDAFADSVQELPGLVSQLACRIRESAF